VTAIAPVTVARCETAVAVVIVIVRRMAALTRQEAVLILGPLAMNSPMASFTAIRARTVEGFYVAAANTFTANPV
jgi:hypothetical protein